MENYELLPLLIFLLFLVTVGLVFTKKIGLVRSLPILGIVIALIAGVPLNGEGESIANYVILKSILSLMQPILIFLLSVMLAQFILKYGVEIMIEELFKRYLANHLRLFVWLTAIFTTLISASIMNLGAVMMTAILFVPLLLKVGFDKQSAVSLILLATSLGSCLNPGYYLIYANLLDLNVGNIKTYCYIMAFICAVALSIYIAVNIKQVKLVKINKIVSSEHRKNTATINYALMAVLVIPFIVHFIWGLGMEYGLFIAVIYGFLALKKWISLAEIRELFELTAAKSAHVIVLLIAADIFMHAVSMQAVADLMKPLFYHLMPESPLQCLFFFTILSPLALYKGPFNLQGMGAGIGAVIMASTAVDPMILGISLLSLNTLRKMVDPIDTQNIVLMQYVDVDYLKVLKKIIPYALSINYCMLFLALLASSAK